jgi:hypothetical protein
MKPRAQERKKGGNETVSPPKAQPRKRSKTRPRLRTAGLLKRLHPDSVPLEPPKPVLAQIPTAENLTDLYQAMCGASCPPEICIAAGVEVGSTWGQALVAQHIKAAAAGDSAAITAVMNRVEGRVLDAEINFANVTPNAEQMNLLLGNIKKKPEILMLFIRLLEEKRILPQPVFVVNFISAEQALKKHGNDLEPQPAALPWLEGGGNGNNNGHAQ